MEHEDPMIVAVALSLYAYNVSPNTRAARLIQYFEGACMELLDLLKLFTGGHAQYIATELPFPTAQVYVEQALAQYREEAERRVVAERGCITA